MDYATLILSVLRSVLLVAIVLVFTGCSSPRTPPPATYPVKGKVTYKGGSPLTGVMIEFRSTSDPSTTMMANIQADGSFELFTIFGNEKLAGGIAGPCQVTVHPPIVPGKSPSAHVLTQPITIEPKENNFTIEIPPEKPSR
jgi:hypothetical protein